MAYTSKISRLLCKPLDIRDEGPFESFGGEQLAARYEFGEENITQPDGFFATRKSLVAVELKLGSASWPEQIAKYVFLMRLEQMKTLKPAENLGLLFIVPENQSNSIWSKVGLNAASGTGGPAHRSTIRRCPPDFFDKLDPGKLPLRVRQLFQTKSEDIKGDIKRLQLAAVSWTWLRDEITKIESELDPEARGDQTLKRLLVGLRAQIEAHGDTGIVKMESAAR